jgi:hypothetical protein
MAATTGRTSPPAGTDPTRGRWWLVVAAVLVQLTLGAVYAWNVFDKPLQAKFGWSKSLAVAVGLVLPLVTRMPSAPAGGGAQAPVTGPRA